MCRILPRNNLNSNLLWKLFFGQLLYYWKTKYFLWIDKNMNNQNKTCEYLYNFRFWNDKINLRGHILHKWCSNFWGHFSLLYLPCQNIFTFYCLIWPPAYPKIKHHLCKADIDLYLFKKPCKVFGVKLKKVLLLLLFEHYRDCYNQRRRIVQKDGGASSNMVGIICPPWSE